MKRLLSVILAGMVVSLAIVSCKDDFNEQEFLQLQHDLKLEQDSVRRARNQAAFDTASKESVQSFINAQNAAGALMAATFVVREDNTPVSGVTVTISSGTAPNASAGRTEAVLTAVTDALGTAVFDAVVKASSVVTLSKPGYVTTTALVSFPAPGAPTLVNLPDGNGGTRIGWIPPAKTFEHFSFPAWSESATAGNTGTINGVFNWQQDLTNDPNVRDPLPPGLVVAADVASALVSSGGITGTSTVSAFKFSGAAGSFGVGAIDPTTGAFSIRVPATAAGLSINLVYPVITASQKIAVRRLNGQDIAPEYRMVPTVWSPGNVASSLSPIPQIPGAKAVFNAGTPPPAPGRGFGVTFAPIARGLDVGTIAPAGTNTQFTLGNTIYNLNLRGRGFTSSPAVTISGGGGTGATATSSLRGFVTSAIVTATGAGYTASTAYDIQFTYTDASATVIPINKIDVTSNGAGEIPLATLTLPVTAGFPGSTAFSTSQGMQGFGVRVVNDNTNVQATATTQATISFSTDTEVLDVAITNGGSGFTSAPTIAFSGGGSPSTNASLSVLVFKSRYSVALGTTPATTPYKLKPAGMTFIFPGNSVEAEVVQANALVDRLSTNLTAVVSNANLLDQLVTDGTNLSALNPQFTFRTTTFGSSAPTLVVLDQNVQPAAANVTISAAGEVTAITNPATDVGAVNVNLLVPDVNNTVPGDGYDGISVAIAPTIATAPGSGAQFLLTTTPDVNSKEVTWGGVSTVVSRGSGYLQNLNRTSTAVDYVAQSAIVVRTGQTVYRLIEGGTGVKQENVQN